MPSGEPMKEKILILGGGFAAVAAAETFVRAGCPKAEVTLVSTNRDLTFYPALVPYVFGDFGLVREDLTFDLASKLKQNGIRFVEGEVLSIDPVHRMVELTGEDVEGGIHYDHLVIALGRRLATENVPGFFEYSHHLLGIDAAERFGKALWKFTGGAIVVGLSPGAFLPIPVCESALALAKRFKDKIADGSVSVTAVFPQALDDAFLGANLFRNLKSAFSEHRIELVEHFPVASIGRNSITSQEQKDLSFDLLMLVPPFRGQAALDRLENAVDARGFLRVDDSMKVEGFDRIYAAGDIVSLPGPRFGYMAIRQGRVAATNVLDAIDPAIEPLTYEHKIAWAIGEKYTDPIYFHYGFWDDSLDDFDENSFFGMARPLRAKYGKIKGFGIPRQRGQGQ